MSAPLKGLVIGSSFQVMWQVASGDAFGLKAWWKARRRRTRIDNGNLEQVAARAGKAILHPATTSVLQERTNSHIQTVTWRFEMKMLGTKAALVTSLALATLFSAQAAHAQRYRAAPQSSYDSVDHSGFRDHRFMNQDQRTIDEITGNDWSAGK